MSDSYPKIPGFQVVRMLGKGGMGAVYEAVQSSLDRKIALKVMLPALSTLDDSFSARFIREAKATANLRHPNIVTIYETGDINGQLFMALEFLEGGSLADLLERGPMNSDRMIEILSDTARALQTAHDRGFVHRDIKPDNILLDLDGRALVADFGIVQTADGSSKITATMGTIGSPHFMSPEQIKGQELDGRSDLYSVGIVLFEMLEGKVPFDGDNHQAVQYKHLMDPLPDFGHANETLVRIAKKLLAKEREDRYQDGNGLLAALTQASGSLPATDQSGAPSLPAVTTPLPVEPVESQSVSGRDKTAVKITTPAGLRSRETTPLTQPVRTVTHEPVKAVAEKQSPAPSSVPADVSESRSSMKPCRGCGKEIHQTASACPHCGAALRTKRYKSRTAVGILAIFVGGLGVHRFYLSQWWGIFYLLFFWTWIPSLIALVEGFVFLLSNSEKWDDKHNEGIPGQGESSAGIVSAAVVGVFVLVAIIGILAAYAIPAYRDYTVMAKVALALNESGAVKQRVQQYVISNEAWPSNGKDLSLSDLAPIDDIESFTISNGGVITIEFSQQIGTLPEATIVLTPTIESNEFVWSCSGGTLAPRYRPVACHQ